MDYRPGAAGWGGHAVTEPRRETGLDAREQIRHISAGSLQGTTLYLQSLLDELGHWADAIRRELKERGFHD